MCLQVIYIVLLCSFHLAIRGQNVKSTTSLSKTAGAEMQSKTFTPTLVVNAEGGSVTTDDLSFKISTNGDPSDKIKNSHVKPRKEAVKSPETSVSSEKELKVIPKNKNNMSKPSQLETPHNPNNTASNPKESTKLSNTIGDKKVNKPTIHVTKKPILSYDELNNVASSRSKGNTLQDLKSSTNPIDSDQIPSPNQEGPNKSFYSNMAARSPSMVIPIVISLLMLPVVAVLGYVGLKKGKEAWKNRHYKRMDFLLDGMYNE